VGGSSFLSAFAVELLNIVGLDRALDSASTMLAQRMAIIEHFKGATTNFAKTSSQGAQVQELLQEKNEALKALTLKLLKIEHDQGKIKALEV